MPALPEVEAPPDAHDADTVLPGWFSDADRLLRCGTQSDAASVEDEAAAMQGIDDRGAARRGVIGGVTPRHPLRRRLLSKLNGIPACAGPWGLTGSV